MNKDQKLAEDHAKWEMGLLRTVIDAMLEVTEKLIIDNFVHGIKHGREFQIDETGIQKCIHKDK